MIYNYGQGYNAFTVLSLISHIQPERSISWDWPPTWVDRAYRGWSRCTGLFQLSAQLLVTYSEHRSPGRTASNYSVSCGLQGS